MNKAIFLDKDGTLIPDIPYNVDPDKITLTGHCIEGLRILAATGYKLFLVSNQSGIARGYFSEAQLLWAIKRLYELFEAEDIRLDAFYYCPHHPQGTADGYNINCDCRKPMPGMLQSAAMEHQLDLGRCWMIGDILNDVEAGNRAGCNSILIDNGNETEWLEGPYRQPEFSCSNINEAATYIYNYNLSDVGLEQR
ncbi:HAD family hydrolase [Mucilaginibacter sp. CAU 1740]|uniref:D-glycero-alpha-D-manno-heptose-1,7-bisphosphate 7-phosphatase n=1 Tax=Mucilaginibacter sp. CAU 1740 TaxID=3140365 RepID=UPI00325B8AF5